MIESVTDRALFLAPTFEDGYDRLPERIAAEAAEAWSRLQRDPLSPGLSWERLFNLGDDARVDSIRVTRKYRLILATMEARFVLLWVDNHDEAYQWAERHRKQIESLVDRASEMQTAGIGVPRSIPRTSEQDPIPIESPDVLVEMAHQGFTQYFAALDEQQSPLVTLDTSGWGGLAFVKGGAGTGKSSIAIRRAIHVASMPGPARGRVLYLCYNRVLAEMVRHTIDSLVDAEVAGAIEVSTLHSWASTYAKGRGRRVSVDRYGQDLQAAVLLARVGLPKEHRDAIAELADDDLVHEIRNVLRPNQFESERRVPGPDPPEEPGTAAPAAIPATRDLASSIGESTPTRGARRSGTTCARLRGSSWHRTPIARITAPSSSTRRRTVARSRRASRARSPASPRT